MAFVEGDDDFVSQFGAPLHKKRCVVDLQVGERDSGNCSTTASDSRDPADVVEEPSEHSFRESFYSSGTDWSSLYCVDDYGIPCESWDLVSTELHTDQSARLWGQGNAGDRSSPCKLWSGLGKSKSDLLLESQAPNHRATGCEPSHAKLVQSSLSSCWGRKLQKTDPGGAVVDVKPQKISNGAVMGELHIWSKFKRPPAASVRLKAQSTTRNSTFYNSDAPTKGNLPTRRKCPFYKKIPDPPAFTHANTWAIVGDLHFGAAFLCSHLTLFVTLDMCTSHQARRYEHFVDNLMHKLYSGCFSIWSSRELQSLFSHTFPLRHYGGLTKSWANGPIYCTPVTARLLALCLYVDEKWIHPLPLGEPHLVDGVEVKMLDANHCPGAAIIHFRLQSGQAILHTGDFRACKAMQDHVELKKGSIHTLYLDTTYCNQRYWFPLQEEVIKYVVEVTHTVLKKNSRILVVVGAYSIGKERVYLGIAEALNVPIFVESRRSRILGALEWPEIVSKLSSDANSTLLHVLPIGHLRPEKLRAYLQSYPKYNAVLAFRPTGWTYSEKIGNELHLLKPTVTGSITVYGVPYSEHSSFTELQEFVQFLQPENIIPTVNVGNPQTRDRMKSYFRQWLNK
ncbi:hypothetical protein L7F22_048660 [Adiantum nelumboides]|nr:hypothetical protein [Adiantum nelumboides]